MIVRHLQQPPRLKKWSRPFGRARRIVVKYASSSLEQFEEERNKTMKPLRLLVGALALLSLSAQAKTVALWPLETNDLRCVVNPLNDLSKVASHFVTGGAEAPWELPPNPDADRHPFVPVNRSAVRESLAGTENGFLHNNYSGRYLRRDKAFTVEGYIKVFDLPASRNTWACILCAYGIQAPDGADANRWTLSLRRQSDENYACSWIFWGYGSQDTPLYHYADEEASYAITNKWLHLALTHEPLGSNGKDHWTLFINGDKVGESSNYGSVTNSYTRHQFDLGGRRGNQGNNINAVFDYWRISDKVLEPSKFLCAGDSSGTSAPAASSTVSYWPLGVTATGGIDCRDAVGNSPLSGDFSSAFVPNRMTPVEDCAFTGNPPNPTVTLPNGNAGSFQGCATAACLKNSDVGTVLNVTSNFTVEGWFCPRICERAEKNPSQETCCYLFGTRPDYGAGWALQYRAKGIDKFLFDLYCTDGTGNLRNNVVLSGEYDMNSWYGVWRHVALTYNATGGDNGFGFWTLYIDGEQVGSSSNHRAPTAVGARPFILGGREAIANHSFQGKVDCVRVSAATLTPAQFLNAADNPQTATDVVGLWPLNVENGAYPDLRDVSGKNNHFATRDSKYSIRLATADPDNAPEISNPDSTVTFRGDPSSMNGSVRYRNPDAATDNHQALLMTYSTEVMDAVAGGKDFTFEFYYLRRKPTKNVSNDQEVFFCAYHNGGAKIRFFRKPSGFYMWEGWNGNLSDTLIPGTSDADLEYDRWYHVALVHSIEPLEGVSSSVWRIYLDGVLKGQPSCTRSGANGSCQKLFVGGREADKNSIIGNLSSVRLSNRALDPSEFLCATPAPSTKPEPTAGYWPIDSIQPGLANLADEEYPLVADGTAAGQAEPARLSIPNKNALTNVVTGVARQNHGSYALGAGGALAAASIGFEMAGPKPFTVEGWLKWTPSEGTADEDLVTVGDALSANGGLRIYFDKTGSSPKLRVFARGAWPCTPYVDGAFDADLTPLMGTWAHVAIAYDANNDEGAWMLYVEGKPVGTVKNFYRPTSVDYSRGGDFTLGSTVHPLSAAVDMWRVSMVAYAPEDFLYAPPGGAIIIFR